MKRECKDTITIGCERLFDAISFGADDKTDWTCQILGVDIFSTCFGNIYPKPIFFECVNCGLKICHSCNFHV